jgi:hypothetical protein
MPAARFPHETNDTRTRVTRGREEREPDQRESRRIPSPWGMVAMAECPRGPGNGPKTRGKTKKPAPSGNVFQKIGARPGPGTAGNQEGQAECRQSATHPVFARTGRAAVGVRRFVDDGGFFLPVAWGGVWTSRAASRALALGFFTRFVEPGASSEGSSPFAPLLSAILLLARTTKRKKKKTKKEKNERKKKKRLPWTGQRKTSSWRPRQRRRRMQRS